MSEAFKQMSMLLVLIISVLSMQHAAWAVEVQLQGQTFTLPAGFTIEVAAASPLVERPITIDFDEQGRLYVAESSGTNEKAAVQLEKKPHRIVRLEDTDGDGRYDRRVTFAENLMFPEGTLWFDGSFYVAAPPSIWKLTDRDGDGVAEDRTEWFAGKTLTGCANDLHGPYLGHDGRIYWCKGAFAEQTYPREHAPPLVTRASHLFRAKPDGSSLEHVMTGGMDNPVDVAFTASGERIVSGTFLLHPAGGQRDGLLHALYGGVYGKVHQVLDGHPRTSPQVLPILAHHGPAASCGLTTYESNVFGNDYRGNLFACLFNLRAVKRHILEPLGGTFRTHDSDFVVSNNWDFHPTDVLEDADGSLLIVDTGGWYKLCCPTSQLVNPAAVGGIYRVRKTDAKPFTDPRGLQLNWQNVAAAELTKRLNDARPAVAKRTMQVLAKQGEAAMPALKAAYENSQSSSQTRMRIVWTATRIESPQARALVRSALRDANAEVRQAAWHSVSLFRDASELSEMESYWQEKTELSELRVIAEALGRSRATKFVPMLLKLLERPQLDWATEHSLVYALIEIGDAPALISAVDAQNATVQRAALMALQAISPEKVPVEAVLRAVSSSSTSLQATGLWLAVQHAEWGEPLANYFREGVQKMPATELETSLVALVNSPPIQALLAEWLRDEARRPLALRTMQQAKLKMVPQAWEQPLLTLVAEDQFAASIDAEQVLKTIQAMSWSAEQLASLRLPLQALANNAAAKDRVRLASAEASSAANVELSSEFFRFLHKQLQSSEPSPRSTSLEILAKSRLTNEQITTLLPLLKTASWQELDRWLGLIARANHEPLSMAALESIEQADALSGLRADQLRTHFSKQNERVRQRVDQLAIKLDADLLNRRKQLETWWSNKPAGDAQRGQAVFTSAACMTCHAVGYVGGKLGPDLTRIGSVRTEQDLLESIIFPSASFVRSYEPTMIVLQDGRIHSGLLKAESAAEIVLVTKPDTELRIPRKTIEELRPGTVSIMPTGLDKQLTPQQLADLLAFLKQCK